MISDTGKNLVFIFSLPRSGSTLLSAVLGSHSTVYCPPEPWILLRLAEVYGNAAENKIYDDYVAGKAVKAFLNEKEFMTSARVFAQATYNSILTKTNQQIFVDKTPRYYHILDFIETLFPAAKKIWLKRNPLDVAASYKITWNRGIDFLVGENLDPVSFDFILGLPNLENYFAQKSPEKLEVKYEDLVHFPEQEIKKIAAFCNIEFEPAMLDLSESGKGLKLVLNSEFGDKKIENKPLFDERSIGHWQKHLVPDEIKKLISFIGGDIFLRMGYQETVTNHPESFDPAINAEVIKKAREKILGNFNHIKTLQMAQIYDLETNIRQHRNEAQTSHEQRLKLTKDLHEMRLQYSILEKINAEKISLVKELETRLHTLEEQLRDSQEENKDSLRLKTQLETKVLFFEEERNHWHNILKEQEKRLASSISEYLQKLDLFEVDKKEKESYCREMETVLQEIKSELRQKEEQYHNIRYSFSYRIGKALLFPFKKIHTWAKNLTSLS